LYVAFSHPGMHFIADAAPSDLQRSRDTLAVAKRPSTFVNCQLPRTLQ
jgi:hypothetical protein